MYSHTLKVSLEKVIIMLSEKINAKFVKEDMRKSFFFANLQVRISQLHCRLTLYI